VYLFVSGDPSISFPSYFTPEFWDGFFIIQIPWLFLWMGLFFSWRFLRFLFNFLGRNWGYFFSFPYSSFGMQAALEFFFLAFPLIEDFVLATKNFIRIIKSGRSFLIFYFRLSQFLPPTVCPLSCDKEQVFDYPPPHVCPPVFSLDPPPPNWDDGNPFSPLSSPLPLTFRHSSFALFFFSCHGVFSFIPPSVLIFFVPPITPPPLLGQSTPPRLPLRMVSPV